MVGTCPLKEVLVNAGPIGIAILSGADDGVLAYTHPCHTQSLILLCPPCLASIALRQLDIVTGFNIVHKLALLLPLPALLILLLPLLAALFVIVLVEVD